MQLWDLTKTFGKLFLLRGRPSDIPYSLSLLLFLTTLFILIRSITYMWFIHILSQYDAHEVIHLSLFAALIVSVIWVLILFAAVRSTLLYYNIVERTFQVSSAVLGMDCIISLIFLIWLGCLSLLHLPLQPGSIAGIGIILSFILVIYWQFMVYIHILVNSMNISILKAGLFALFYQLVQQNLAEILINVLINVTSV